MAAEISAIVTASAVVGGVAKSTSLAARSGMLQARQWLDRKRGLKLLKNLPTGLEALLYGDDMTPEILAALSLGGKPGRELSTLALLTTTDWGISGGLENLLCLLLEEEATTLPTNPIVAPALMDDDFRMMHLLDGQEDRNMLVHTYSSKAGLSLDRNAYLVVVAYCLMPYGVVVYGSTDGCFYYCADRFGQVRCSSVDTCPERERGLDVTATTKNSQVFTVPPGVLNSYPEFSRMCQLLGESDLGDLGVVGFLGLAEVARSLGLRFAEEITGGSCEDLLSRNHLRNVHKMLGSGHDPRKMPKDIRALVREAAQALPLSERKYERTRFGATQETTAAYVEAVRSLAESTGNVGVRKTVSEESCLIKSCLVGSLGMEQSFAIFPGFRSSKLNIAVSPGCTVMYFPGLNITVAFPDGSATGARVRKFRPACPFTSDLSETIGVLMDLAPKIGKGRLRKVAAVLSKELASDPSLVLDPVTENVVRAFGTSVDETPAQRSLIELLRSSSLGEGRFHREAAMAGVLCQLGLNFSVAGGADMRCFFDCCRKQGWGVPRGNVGDVLVDCKVDISGCHFHIFGKDVFLGNGRDTGFWYRAMLTGPGIGDDNFLLEDCQQGGNYHLESTDIEGVFARVVPRPFPVKCYVDSSGTPVK